MAIIANTKTCLFFYNKNNKIINKLNNNILVEIIKKQTLKKFVYKINIYFIKNNINIIIFCVIQTLLSKDIIIQVINEKKFEKLRRENDWKKIPKSIAKLAQK